MELIRFEEILQGLNRTLEFCESIDLGNDIAASRFADYRGRIAHLIEIVDLRQRGREVFVVPQELVTQLREYVAALMESVEFSSLLPYLRQCNAALTRPKLRQTLKGPVLPSDEDAASNQARNIQFELYLAHQLWRAGLMPTLGEHPDLTCEMDGTVFLFECKRLYSNSTRVLRKRIQQAGNQLYKSRSRSLSGACGIVAISLSTLFNPEYTAVPVANRSRGSALLESWLMEQTQKVSGSWPSLAAKKAAVGILFHAASPFVNLEIERFDLGQYIIGYSLVPDESPYARAVLKLAAAMKAIEY
jgi:hypothetical protein